MNKIVFLSLILIFSSTQLYAQSGDYIELRDGTIVEGEVKISERLFRSSRIIINDTTYYPLNEVMAYKQDGEYYRRIGLNFNTGNQFAMRTEKGNIDLYERMEYSYSNNWVPGPNGTMMFMGGGFNGNNVQYFAKDSGPVLKANARNLKTALSDNPQSMSYLKKRDGLTAVQVIGIIGGIAIAGASISAQADKENPDFTGAFLGVGVVTGSAWIPFFAKQDLVRKAIEEYNRPVSQF